MTEKEVEELGNLSLRELLEELDCDDYSGRVLLECVKRMFSEHTVKIMDEDD